MNRCLFANEQPALGLPFYIIIDPLAVHSVPLLLACRHMLQFAGERLQLQLEFFPRLASRIPLDMQLTQFFDIRRH